jgi:hypothetical protein
MSNSVFLFLPLLYIWYLVDGSSKLSQLLKSDQMLLQEVVRPWQMKQSMMIYL